MLIWVLSGLCCLVEAVAEDSFASICSCSAFLSLSVPDALPEREETAPRASHGLRGLYGSRSGLEGVVSVFGALSGASLCLCFVVGLEPL